MERRSFDKDGCTHVSANRRPTEFRSRSCQEDQERMGGDNDDWIYHYRLGPKPTTLPRVDDQNSLVPILHIKRSPKLGVLGSKNGILYATSKAQKRACRPEIEVSRDFCCIMEVTYQIDCVASENSQLL
jgi:hypothetical protein